jgi:uncharacterized membrane protein YfcA
MATGKNLDSVYSARQFLQGVAVAHKISAASLKQVFGLLLLMVSGRMLFGLV